MSVSFSRGCTTVRCDHKYSIPVKGEPDHCVETFRSFSERSVIATQLELAKWHTVKGGRHTATLHFCWQHVPKSRYAMP